MRLTRAVAAIAIAAAFCFPTEAAAGRPEEAKAAKLFERAESEYQAGRFQAAIDLLLEAQRLAPDAVLHYNLARAYEGIGDLDHAIESYSAYVREDPNSKDRGAVEVRLKTLEEQKRARDKPPERVAPPPPPVTKPPPPPPQRTASPIPWVIAGVGALGVGAGGVLAGLSLGKSNEAEDPATSGVGVNEALDAARSFALGANIAFGVGGAIALAGTIWGIVDVATLGKSETKAARVRIGPTGVTLVAPF